MQRFWSKVSKTDTCWNWSAGLRGNNGYGAFKFKGITYTAHRFSWFLTYGKFPHQWMLHKCDNRLCVRPDHLFDGSPRDNVLDAIKKGRMITVGVRTKLLPRKNRKISSKLASLIREQYLSTKTSYEKLAIKYSISQSIVRAIIQYPNWYK